RRNSRPRSALLPSCRAAAPSQVGAGLGEDSVHEAVGPAVRLGESPDARPLVILLLQLRGELVPRCAGNAGTLFEVCHLTLPNGDGAAGTMPAPHMITQDRRESYPVTRTRRLIAMSSGAVSLERGNERADLVRWGVLVAVGLAAR